jgi:hypothetical protein
MGRTQREADGETDHAVPAGGRKGDSQHLVDSRDGDRGAAGEDLHNVERLWEEVAQAWQRHIADEEPLIRRLAPLLRPEQALSLITLLRRPAGLSLTRPHPTLLRGGCTTRMAIHLECRIDQWRDVLDNRESLRTGD